MLDIILGWPSTLPNDSCRKIFLPLNLATLPSVQRVPYPFFSLASLLLGLRPNNLRASHRSRLVIIDTGFSDVLHNDQEGLTGGFDEILQEHRLCVIVNPELYIPLVVRYPQSGPPEKLN